MNWSTLAKVAGIASAAWFVLVAIRNYERCRGLGPTLSLLGLLCWLNWLAFWLIGVSIGGSAQLGGIKAGHYFVADHSNVTEVTAWVYWYSWVHGATQAITLPLGVMAGFILRGREEDAQPSSPDLRGRGAA